MIRNAGTALSLVFLALLLASCNPADAQIPGHYQGLMKNEQGLWMNIELTALASHKYVLFTQIADEDLKTSGGSFETGTWSLEGSSVLCQSEGSKDRRFRYEGAGLYAASLAALNPGEPADEFVLFVVH